MGLRPTPRGMKMGYAEHARRASRLLPSHFNSRGQWLPQPAASLKIPRPFAGEGERRGGCGVFATAVTRG
jgi:hypothetical protein